MKAETVPVLMYHSISTQWTPKFRPYVIDPSLFAEHMGALQDGGYEPMTVSQYVSRSREQSSVEGRRAVVLTFDDAFLDFHTTVLPILIRLDFPATLYVPTDFVGRTSLWLEREGEADRPVMSWTALREVAVSGIEVGSHSRSHPQLDLLAAQQVRAELVGSKAELEDRLQLHVDSLAYPFGYYNSAVQAQAAAAGYKSACAVRDLVSDLADPLVISRWTVRNGMDADDVINLIESRTGRMSVIRSDARAFGSRLLRRSRLKHRGSPSSKGP